MSKCDVCNDHESVGVASSTLGAISFSYCRRCLDLHAEPYEFLVSVIGCSVDRDSINDLKNNLAYWILPIIAGTLEVAGKTMEEFEEDVWQEFLEQEKEWLMWEELEKQESSFSLFDEDDEFFK